MVEINNNFGDPSISFESRKQPAIMSEVLPVGKSFGEIINSPESIEQFVEAPLQKACGILYDKNIQTVGSDAGITHGAKSASVMISWETLSLQNRDVAKTLGLYPTISEWGHHGEIITIELPVDEKSSVAEVSDYFERMADNFVSQEPKWIPQYTMEDLRKIYGYPEDVDSSPGDFKDEGYYYDDKNQIFYRSEDHYSRTKQWEGGKDQVEVENSEEI